MTRIKNWFLTNLTIILAALLVIVSAIGLYQSVQINGIKVGPFEITGLAEKAARAGEVKKSLGTSEARRVEETAQSQQSYQAAKDRCTDRIVTITRAGETIKEIVNAPPPQEPLSSADPAPGDLPLRGAIVGADRLRDVVGQPRSPAALLSPGSDFDRYVRTAPAGRGGDTPAGDAGGTLGGRALPDVAGALCGLGARAGCRA